MKPHRWFVKVWNRLTWRRRLRKFERAQQPATPRRGLFLTQKAREEARITDEFWREFNEHRRLEGAASLRDEHSDGWFNRRSKDRF
jgi:hypothetical protein